MAKRLLALTGVGVISGLVISTTTATHNNVTTVNISDGSAVAKNGEFLIIDKNTLRKNKNIDLDNTLIATATTHLYAYIKLVKNETFTKNIRQEQTWETRTHKAKLVLIADNQKDAWEADSNNVFVLLSKIHKSTFAIENESTYSSGWASLHSYIHQAAASVAFPHGTIYVQYPQQKRPEDLYPMIEWSDITQLYGGAFFRCFKDGLSNKFSDQKRGKALDPLDLQEDAGRNATGSITNLVNTGPLGFSGFFYHFITRLEADGGQSGSSYSLTEARA